MPSSIKVPALGESITEAIIANWLQPVGARVEVDQPLVELETDKVTVEVPSPSPVSSPATAPSKARPSASARSSARSTPPRQRTRRARPQPTDTFTT
jgi:hypothetical protein